MATESFAQLILRLRSLPDETEWVEFKTNKAKPEDIGEQLSALSNSAALCRKERGFLVWGIKDQAHEIVGTAFRPRKLKVGNENLENWLATQLRPRVNFEIQEIYCGNQRCVLLSVEPASHRPVAFRGTEWVRVGSYKKKLRDHPEKERLLWKLFTRESFESGVALRDVHSDTVLDLLNYTDYFELSGQRLPDSKKSIFEALESDDLIGRTGDDQHNITNLAAVLFARDLRKFKELRKKSVRVVFYAGQNRVETQFETEGQKGYASGFSGLVTYIRDVLPRSEQMREALRTDVPMYPEVAIRELIANALVHQDFDAVGAGPMIEIFTDRIEITNPGTPLIDVQRFLDLPPRSRNDLLAGLMRRLKVCEERGSGIDKVFASVEIYQLPPPDFQVQGDSTKAILFGPKEFPEMTKGERVRACYQHAGLQYVSNQMMTNASLRKRLNIADRNYATASRIISDATTAGLIKSYDPTSKSRRHAKYLPFWA